MSGGSWGYLFQQVGDAATRLQEKGQRPERVAFGRHLELVAKALHAIEWVDSFDFGKGDEIEPIRCALIGARSEEQSADRTGIEIKCVRLAKALCEIAETCAPHRNSDGVACGVMAMALRALEGGQ